jgi:hypothetical protein
MNLRKIPLESLINILADLYDGGADYIDITSEKNEEDLSEDASDIMRIVVKPEYITNEIDVEIDDDYDFEEEEYIDEDEKKEQKRLSDEDINDLI